jgi:hypothetical protein
MTQYHKQQQQQQKWGISNSSQLIFEQRNLLNFCKIQPMKYEITEKIQPPPPPNKYSYQVYPSNSKAFF